MLRYDAPYPTEALFLALLESFRFEPAQTPDPSGAFAAGALTWTPAPYDATIEAGGVWVQRRERMVHEVVRHEERGVAGSAARGANSPGV